MYHMLGRSMHTAKGKHYNMKYHTSHGPWEVVSADIFMGNNKTLVCNIDNCTSSQKVAGFSANDLVWRIKLIFAECGLPEKIISDARTNFT